MPLILRMPKAVVPQEKPKVEEPYEVVRYMSAYHNGAHRFKIKKGWWPVVTELTWIQTINIMLELRPDWDRKYTDH